VLLLPEQLQIFAPKFSEGTLHCAAASEDGKLLATGCADGKVRLWLLETGQPLLEPLDHGEEAVTTLAFDLEGRRLASGGKDGNAKIWNLQSGELAAEKHVHDSEVSAIAFSPDEIIVATGSHDGESRLWWPAKDGKLSPAIDNVARVNHLGFNPAGSALASFGSDNVVRLCDTATWEEIVASMRHIDKSTYGLFLLWTQNGRQLVSGGSGDSSARVWDAQTGRMLAKPMEQPNTAYAVAMRLGGDALLVASRSARVWDLGSGEPLTPLLPHDYRIYTAAFDQTGRRFVTGTRGWNAYIWALPAPSEALPDWFLEFAEALGGFRFNQAGVLEQVPSAHLPAIRQNVLAQAHGEGGAVSEWMRWLATGPSVRTTSPESRVTFDQFVEQLVSEGTAGSLRKALHHRPGDLGVMAKLGVVLAGKSNASEAENHYGKFLVGRAARLAPDDLDIQLERGRLLLAGEKPEDGLLNVASVVLAHPETAEAWFAFGQALERLGWIYDAAAAYQQAASLFGKIITMSAATDPEDVAPQEKAREALAQLRKQVPARDSWEFDRVVREQSQDRIAVLRQVFGQLLSANPLAAVRAAAAALREEPDSSPLWESLGNTCVLASSRLAAQDERNAAGGYLHAGFAALVCGSPSNARRTEVVRLLAGDLEPWIDGSAEWTYLDGEASRTPPEDWIQPEFDDASWERGPQPLGYGDGDEATVLDFGEDPRNKPAAAFFRHAFDVADSESVRRLALRFRCDDGVQVFLNSEEIHRFNLPDRQRYSPDMLATSVVGTGTEEKFYEPVLPADGLLQGRNVLAVSVHQQNPASSDLQLELTLGPALPSLADVLGELETGELATLLGFGEFEEVWMRGNHAFEQKDYDQASEAFEEALRLRPESWKAANYLGVLHRFGDRLDQAANSFERAIQNIPGGGESSNVHTNLQATRHEIGHRANLANIPERSPNSSEKLIDLSAHYTSALNENPNLNQSDPENTLAGLKPGIHRFGDVDFDVRGIVFLTSKAVSPGFRLRFRSESVKRRTPSISFMRRRMPPIRTARNWARTRFTIRTARRDGWP
jgi:WD40 repeat protein/tetratricopeptide (TPR) repeat protein